MHTALMALAAALLFGLASTFSRIGLRHLSPRRGAAVSVPSTLALLLLLAPWLFTLHDADPTALLIFAVAGLFFPAAVTLLNFEATRRMGPTIASALQSTSAVFAIASAMLFLGEAPHPAAFVGAATIVGGVLLLTWRPGAAARRFAPWVLLIPLTGALIRGSAQTAVKTGLSLWPQPYMATLFAYTLSAVVVTVAGARRPLEPPGQAPAGHRVWAVFSLVGLCNGGALLLTYAALASGGSVSLVAPIVTSAPLFTLIASHLLKVDEPATARSVAGVLLTMAGVVILLVL